MRRVLLGLVMSPLLATAVPSRMAPTAPAEAAGTGAIRGRVAFLRDVKPPDPRPAITDLGMRDPHPGTREERVAVVYLETAPRGAFEERPGPTVVLDQRNETFVPHVLAITTGTTVQFLNSDKTYHNVFSLSRPKRFDLGRYPTGRSKSVRFDRPGIVRVFCEIHSHMSAFILVFAHRHFAVTSPRGEYRIEGLPPGSYTVTVWHPVLAAKTRAVRIAEEGGDHELDFELS
jgi:plastocyanin